MRWLELRYYAGAMCFGFSLGAAWMWWHFTRHRLLRSEYEWYSDPVVRRKYPADAFRVLSQRDEPLED